MFRSPPISAPYPPALPDLYQRVANAPAARFKRTRPRGIVLAIASAVGPGKVLARSGEPLPVRRRVSVFGEGNGNERDASAGPLASPPYLAICLAGRSSADGPVTILRAYAHPALSARHLLLVDSNLDRLTLAELLRLQSWPLANKGIRVEIEKPHFDIVEDGTADPEPAPREPCIADFVLKAEGEAARGARIVLVETMGFAHETHRARKRVAHELMAQLTEAPVVLHDFHVPVDSTQAARDRRFWPDGRWAITGPDETLWRGGRAR
jgi:hypothetical protein